MSLPSAGNLLSLPPWRPPSPSGSDCDSGAFSRCSTPGLLYNSEESPLVSPPLVLSVIKRKSQDDYQAQKFYALNPKLLLSCLNEAGKSSKFCSLQNLKSTKIKIHQSHILGSLPDICEGRLGGGWSRPESSLSWWWDNEFGCSDTTTTRQTSLGVRRPIRTRNCEKNCNNQVTVNGKHLCSFS